ncbi:hypothetical protein [Streptomyces niveus]|uniref:hypothetical protein n=1 Tax=Streptomyces niveus TaxID=193462 RepID=UPI00342EF41C
MRFNLVRTAAVAGLAAGVLLTGVPTTTAAPASAVAAPTVSSAVVSAAPTCVHLHQEDYMRDGQWRSLANAKNNCSHAVRIRMIWTGTTDGRCFSLNPGQDHGESKPGRGPYVSELRDC